MISCKDAEKIIDALQKLINTMKDLTMLATKHSIENDLYHGDGLEKVIKLLDDDRVNTWISENCEKTSTRQQSWESLIKFLEKESKILQQKVTLLGKDDARLKHKSKDDKNDGSGRSSDTTAHPAGTVPDTSLTCSICDEKGHVATMGPGFKKVIQFFSCKKFVEMTNAERFAIVKEKGLCFQCLLP